MERVSTISNLILKVPQLLKQRGDMTAGILTHPLSRLNNVIHDSEGEILSLLDPYYDIPSSKVLAWCSNPEPLTEDYQNTGEILKSHIELLPDARTQFIYIEIIQPDNDLKMNVVSDEYGRMGQFDYKQEIDLLSIGGFKIKEEAFQGEMQPGAFFGFSIYRYHPGVIQLFSLKAAINFLNKVFTSDMPESSGTMSDYENELNQHLSQIRFGRAHLRATPRRYDTTPLGLDWGDNEPDNPNHYF